MRQKIFTTRNVLSVIGMPRNELADIIKMGFVIPIHLGDYNMYSLRDIMYLEVFKRLRKLGLSRRICAGLGQKIVDSPESNQVVTVMLESDSWISISMCIGLIRGDINHRVQTILGIPE